MLHYPHYPQKGPTCESSTEETVFNQLQHIQETHDMHEDYTVPCNYSVHSLIPVAVSLTDVCAQSTSQVCMPHEINHPWSVADLTHQ